MRRRIGAALAAAALGLAAGQEPAAEGVRLELDAPVELTTQEEAFVGALHAAARELAAEWLASDSPAFGAGEAGTLDRVRVAWERDLDDVPWFPLAHRIISCWGTCVFSDPTEVRIGTRPRFGMFPPLDPRLPAGARLGEEILAHEFAHGVLFAACPRSAALPPVLIESLTEIVAVELLARVRGVDRREFAFAALESSLVRFEPPRENPFESSDERWAAWFAVAVAGEPPVGGEPPIASDLVELALHALSLGGSGSDVRTPEPDLVRATETLLEFALDPTGAPRDVDDSSGRLFQSVLRTWIERRGLPTLRVIGRVQGVEDGALALLSVPQGRLVGAGGVWLTDPRLLTSAPRVRVRWITESPALLLAPHGDEWEDGTTRLRHLVWRGGRPRLGEFGEQSATVAPVMTWRPPDDAPQLGEGVLTVGEDGALSLEVDGAPLDVDALVPGARLVGIGLDGVGALVLGPG